MFSSQRGESRVGRRPPHLAVRGSCLIRLPKLVVAGAQKIRASGRSIGAGRACRRPSRRDRRWILAEDKGERTRRRGARPGRRSAGRLCFRWFRPDPQAVVRARIKESPAIEVSEAPNLFSTNASGQQVLRHAHLLLPSYYYPLFTYNKIG